MRIKIDFERDLWKMNRRVDEDEPVFALLGSVLKSNRVCTVISGKQKRKQRKQRKQQQQQQETSESDPRSYKVT